MPATLLPSPSTATVEAVTVAPEIAQLQKSEQGAKEEDASELLPVPGLHSPRPASRKIILGVCAMEKKTKAKPMTHILDRLRAYGEFEVIVWSNDMIFNDPVESWPICDCFISFYSKGFPHHKAVEYVELRRPYCINDVPSQVCCCCCCCCFFAFPKRWKALLKVTFLVSRNPFTAVAFALSFPLSLSFCLSLTLFRMCSRAAN